MASLLMMALSLPNIVAWLLMKYVLKKENKKLLAEAPVIVDIWKRNKPSLESELWAESEPTIDLDLD